MTTDRPMAVIAVFADQHDAQQAIMELQRAGFQDDQIGVAARHVAEPVSTEIQDLRHDPRGDNYAAEGAVTGIAAGAGLGAIAGLAILAGLLPPIGPAIAGGTLAVVLSTAAAGAAAVGLAGALAGLGVSHEEASYYESEFHAGRIVVAVTARGRELEAREIMKRYGGYDMSDQVNSPEEFAARGTASMSAAETGTPVAMPMEPGVPAQVNLAGESIASPAAQQHNIPVRSEDLVTDSTSEPRRSTVRVPIQAEDVEPRSRKSNP